jgi:hypothetical protein
MPLEDLGAHVSDSGYGIHSRNSDALPECRQYDSDPNATDAHSQVDRTELTVTEAQKFDGLSDSNDSSNHPPAQKFKRQRFTPERVH